MPQRKNVHQLHIEQLVSMGEDGLREINYKLSNFINSFNDTNDNLNITIKVDGSPAVQIYSHIGYGYPDNGIGLKSLVANKDNAITSEEQIEVKYGDRPNMAAMLMFCLKIAPSIPKGEIWQGDCLFTSNTKKVKNINGKECIIFQPNKVVYAFSEDNPGYEKIKAANFGICFHTIYKLTSKGLSQSFKIDPTVLNVPEDIYIMSPAVNTPKMGFDVNKAEEDYSKLQELENKLLNNKAYEELVNNEIFKQFWPMFENHITSDKASTTINVNEFYKELTDFIKEKHDASYSTRVAKLKTAVGKERAKTAYDSEVVEIANLLKTNKDVLTDMVNVFNQVVKIKMDIFKYLKNAPRDYDTYLYKASGEYEPTSGEGFSMSDQDGNIVKIVDRSEFAHANRSKDYLSGFEHESLDEMIVKTPKGYEVKSEKKGKDGHYKKLGGPYKTKAEAEKRLQQVHYFKYKTEDLNESHSDLESEKNRIKDVINVMKDVQYGFISKRDGQKITDRELIHSMADDGMLDDFYDVETDPEKTIKNKLGICIDQSLAVKYLMNKHHPEDDVVLYSLTKPPKGHCVPCYCHDGKWYYLECAWDKERGLHGPFDSQDELVEYLEYIYNKNHKDDTPKDSEVEVKEYETELTENFEYSNSDLINDLRSQRLYDPGSLNTFSEDMKYVATAVTDEFKGKGKVNIVGHKITNDEDLANLFTCFRDRRFETLRVIYVKDNTVVATENTTSRLPGMTTMLKHHGDSGLDFDYTVMKLKTKYDRVKADGYYLFHNHPSGDPTPSKADFETTQTFVDLLPGFLGHIILGDASYAVIDSDMHVSYRELEDKYDKQSLVTISNIDDIVNTANHYAFDDDVSLVFYVDAENCVNAIQEIDNYEFNNENISKYLYNQGIQNGTHRLYVVTKDIKLFNKLGQSVIKGVIRDIIFVKDNKVINYSFTSRMPSNKFDELVRSYDEAINEDFSSFGGTDD